MKARCLSLFAPLLCCSCIVLSVHPFVAREEAIFERALLGRWESESGEWMEFKPGELPAYAVVYGEDGRETRFVAMLTEIGEQRYLDVQPVGDPEGDPIGHILALRTHMLFRIVVEEEELTLAMLSARYLRELGKESDGSMGGLQFTLLEDDELLLLTSGTTALRRFIEERLEDPKLFEEPGSFRRKEAE